jgi:hypothetical protein
MPAFTPQQDEALKAVAGWLKAKPGRRDLGGSERLIPLGLISAYQNMIRPFSFIHGAMREGIFRMHRMWLAAFPANFWTCIVEHPRNSEQTASEQNTRPSFPCWKRDMTWDIMSCVIYTTHRTL